jgi:hypothetical protein
MAADAEGKSTVVRRSVTFGEVEVRPYFVTAGDNPGTSGWSPTAIKPRLGIFNLLECSLTRADLFHFLFHSSNRVSEWGTINVVMGGR